jgi:hypothetical protein
MDYKKTFTCDVCNYTTIKPSDWIKHINSAKHKRGGNKKSKKCEECELEFFSHWNLKHHILVTHSAKEERDKQKYYCKDCDQVFFCSQYMKKHIEGKRHKNYVLAIQLENELKIKSKI